MEAASPYSHHKDLAVSNHSSMATSRDKVKEKIKTKRRDFTSPMWPRTTRVANHWTATQFTLPNRQDQTQANSACCPHSSWRNQAWHELNTFDTVCAACHPTCIEHRCVENMFPPFRHHIFTPPFVHGAFHNNFLQVSFVALIDFVLFGRMKLVGEF